MPTRLPSAWFALAALSFVLPIGLLSVLQGASGFIIAALMPALAGAASGIAMGFAYRFFVGATGASDIRVAGWIHWTLWLIATLCNAAFWAVQSAGVSSGSSASSLGTTLGIVSMFGGALHLFGWIAFIAAVSSARRSDGFSRPSTFS